MIILGIDPGFAQCGIAECDWGRSADPDLVGMDVIVTVKSDKKLKTLSTDDRVRRTRELYKALRPYISSANVVCIESMSLPRNASSSAMIGLAYGAIVSLCTHYDRPLLQASPQEIKVATAGKKSATKEEVSDYLEQRFDYSPSLLLQNTRPSWWHHAHDALGAIVACLDSEVIGIMRAFEKEKR